MKRIVNIAICFLILMAFGQSVNGQEINKSISDLTASNTATIQRTLCIKFKKGTSKETIQKQIKDFLALKDSISYILSLKGGITVQGELEERSEYDVMYYFTFRNEDDIKKYYYHPNHLSFFEKNGKIWDKFLVINSEL